MELSELKFAGIYKFTNKENGKVYIGQSKNIHKRYHKHKEMRAKGLFASALKKYGVEGFEFEVLERVDNLEILDDREQYWMDFYESYIRGKGYNICVAPSSKLGQKIAKWNKMRLIDKNYCASKGAPGKKHNEETRRKISEKAKGRICHPTTRLATSRTFAGKPKPEQQREKIKKAISKRVEQVDPKTGNVIRVWLNVTEIAKETGLTACTIRECCMGYYWDSRAKRRRERNGLYNGFIWQYTTESETTSTFDQIQGEVKVVNRKKKVSQMDPQSGKTIEVWESLQAVKYELGFWPNSIAEAIKKGISYKGYNWEFSDPDTPITAIVAERKAFPKRKPFKPVVQIDLSTGMPLRQWRSAAEASRELGFGETSITNACQGRYWDKKTQRFYYKDTYKGYKWQYVSDTGEAIRFNFDEVKLVSQARNKKVAQIDLATGEVLRIWANTNEISKELGCHADSIQHVCRGRYLDGRTGKYKEKLSFAGYKWQYVEE